MLDYKKPAFWLAATAVIISIAVAVCFLTNPKNEPSNLNNSPANESSLTLDDVVTLSQKGKNLTWEDFEQFTYKDTGSGLYIRVYDINSQFSLWIGDGKLKGSPMYIHLTDNTDPADYIDIRTEDVESFIRKHENDIYDDISDLLNIISSPSFSSATGDYIREHQSEYDKLLSYGEYTLHYCFKEFLMDNQTDLRGHIMAIACQDIMEEWGEILTIDGFVENGQDWFEAFQENAKSLQTKYTLEEIEELYPGTWILLKIL